MTAKNMKHARMKPVDPPRIMKEGYHHDGGGLYLQVRRQKATGNMTRSWVFMFTLHGKSRNMGLGPLHTVGLADARRQAEAARRMLLDGIDPLAAREVDRAARRIAAAASMTFKDCADRYAAAHRAGWSAKHANDWTASLATHAYPLLGNLPAGSGFRQGENPARWKGHL